MLFDLFDEKTLQLSTFGNPIAVILLDKIINGITFYNLNVIESF